MSATRRSGDSGGLSRRQARLAAVQGLYQMDLAHTDLGAPVDAFSALEAPAPTMRVTARMWPASWPLVTTPSM